MEFTTFSGEEDTLIWQYESKGIYSSKSLYAIINFRGVQPVFLPAVWNIRVPPKIQGLLWLFSQNKIMTCDNLRKRGMAKPLECVHCKEIESVYHLFFECVVARQTWSIVESLFQVSIVKFESVASLWLCDKKYLHLIVITYAVLWGLWNARNAIVFNRCSWISMKQVLGPILRYLRDWTKVSKDLQGGMLMTFQSTLGKLLNTPFALEPD